MQKEVEAFFMSAVFFLFTITFGDLSYTVCTYLMCHIDSVSTQCLNQNVVQQQEKCLTVVLVY